MMSGRTDQLSFAEALVRGTAAGPLDRLDGLVAWDRFEHLIGTVRVEASTGRPPWPSLVLFKALVLQSLYGLSERELETALADRLSFRRFVGLALDQGVPDHTVLNRFRNHLVGEGLLERLFAELDRQLETAGAVLKHGTMLDATLIETQAAAPPSRRAKASATEEAPIKAPTDPDAAFVRRSGKPGCGYGYKAHVGVDAGSGLIRSLIVTPANVNETVVADGLVRGDERAVWADAAYHTHARVAALKARGIKPRLMRRPNKHHPVLAPRLRRYNRLIARTRSAVETTFATWKRRMGLDAIRYRGLVKAQAQVLLAAFAFNLRRWAAMQGV